MKSSASNAIIAILAAALATGCMTGAYKGTIATVSGCVESAGLTPGLGCTYVELHIFQPGLLTVPGSYVLSERQHLAPAGCFQFVASLGDKVSVKTRDTDRAIVGASVYVTAGEASTNLILRHTRHFRGDSGEGEQTACDIPLADSDK